MGEGLGVSEGAARRPRLLHGAELLKVRQAIADARVLPARQWASACKPLEDRRMAFKHMHALHAASSMAGHSSWHTNEEAGMPRLRLTPASLWAVHLQPPTQSLGPCVLRHHDETR
jgi:hypothetical protein